MSIDNIENKPKVTRDSVLEYIVKSEKLARDIRNICPQHLLYDFIPFFHGEMCLVKEHKLIEAYEKGEIDFLCIRVILNQIRSTTSRFYKLYRKDDSKHLTEINVAGIQLFESNGDQGSSGSYNVDVLDLIVDEREEYDEEVDRVYENRLKLIEDVSSKFHWYDKYLWDEYYKGRNSIASISRATGVNYKSVHYSIMGSKKKIRAAYAKKATPKKEQPEFKNFIIKQRNNDNNNHNG